jgi:hypothetical protein
MTITFTATGNYERSDLPDSLGVGLAEEIQRHMEGYGFTEVTVSRSNIGANKPLDSTTTPE